MELRDTVHTVCCIFNDETASELTSSSFLSASTIFSGVLYLFGDFYFIGTSYSPDKLRVCSSFGYWLQYCLLLEPVKA